MNIHGGDFYTISNQHISFAKVTFRLRYKLTTGPGAYSSHDKNRISAEKACS